MEGVSTSTAGFVGMAEKGKVIGTPEFVSSFADFNRKFGGYLPESTYGEYRYLAYAVEQFFANGGPDAMLCVPQQQMQLSQPYPQAVSPSKQRILENGAMRLK